MTIKTSGAKGLKTEELVRAYFIRAGFFVLRGIQLNYEGIDLTDIDMWIYERSATLARRRTIIDIKDKKSPQAAERLFFVKGVASVIGVEGAGVATTDNRVPLRELARKHGLQWISGADLQRLKESDALSGMYRLSEEQLMEEINNVDSMRNGRVFRTELDRVRSSVATKFGIPCANIALDGFQNFARATVSAHPDSNAARLAGRLSYLSAAIAAAAFDFALADVALRPSGERVQYISDAIRYGGSPKTVIDNMSWTETALREFVPDGHGLAQAIRQKIINQLYSIPAEGVAEFVVRLGNSDRLFNVAKSLEAFAYAPVVNSFDLLDGDSRAFMGALLDFSDLSRKRFATAWLSKPLGAAGAAVSENITVNQETGLIYGGEVSNEEKEVRDPPLFPKKLL